MLTDSTALPEAEERVMQGARLLDERTPGWERKIELEFLDMGDVHCCILGQVYDDLAYSEALDYLETNLMSGAYHGFDRDGESYSDLKQLWLKEIAKRQEEELDDEPTKLPHCQ
jgi:hypothetical protein